MKKIYIFLLLVFMLPLGACAIEATPEPSAQVIHSDKQRLIAEDVTGSDVKTLVNGNTTFALNVYHQLQKTNSDANIFYSPYSISAALAMVYAGAKNDTDKQMATALNFTLTQDRLHPAFNSLDTALNSRGKNAKGINGGPFQLHLVNAIWGQKDFTFLPTFLDTLSQNYGAGLRTLDFTKAPDQSRVTINDWVADQTNQKIKDLIPQGAVDSMTRLVLTNAVYFNAAWLYQFKESNTKNQDFNLLNGSKVNVPMMNETEHLAYAPGNGYQAVELPYDGSELTMLIVLPDAGKFNSVVGALTSDQLNTIIQSLKQGQINLTMPKFTFETSFSLNDILSALGMPSAFTSQADFSGMTGTPNLYISDVFHKAFIAVNEAGTEAAAATAAIMGLTAMPVTPTVVTLDRPFMFFIRDVQTGAIVFMGSVTNPK
jgi:serpin B